MLFEEHGRFYPEVLNKKRRFFNRMFLQHITNKVVAVSEDVKERLFTYEGVNIRKTAVVYNGTRPPPSLNTEKQKSLRHRFGLKEKDIVIGAVGRLDPIKNLPLLIKGFQKAKSECPDLKCIIIGNGPLEVEIKKMIKDMKLDNDIVMAGYQPNASELVGMMDIFALVSFSVGTSMALLESMAAGIPSIVTDVGGNPEIVVNNKTGWIIPTDDLSAMTNAIIDAATDQNKRTIIGNQAKKRFKNNFTFKKMIDQYNQIYSDLLIK